MPASGLTLVALIGVAVWARTLVSVIPPLLRRWGALRSNFRGDQIVTCGGSIVVLGALPGLLALQAIHNDNPDLRQALGYALVAFGALGLVDDIWGSPASRGLRGHVRALLREGRITSGLIKAVGGLLAAGLIASFALSYKGLAAFGATLAIALGANTGNLLDLRPGRAGGVLLVLLTFAIGTLAWFGDRVSAAAVATVAIAAGFTQWEDSASRLMLGDTGSNALGAATAIAILASLPPDRLWILVALLIALHLAAERWSLTKIIARYRLLRYLDGLTGVRDDSRDGT
ncbi:MAG: hypothetical protein HUU17_04160 [Chthonomonadales bacterium]|nr:hypothetical protein [Chthonomonadales bacterium]